MGGLGARMSQAVAGSIVHQVGRVLKSATPAPAFNPRDPNHAPRRRERGRRDDGYGDVASDEMSQTFTVLSSLPLTIRFPPGVKLTLVTPSACPLTDLLPRHSPSALLCRTGVLGAEDFP